MHINDFPCEIVYRVLELAMQAQRRESATYTYGLSQAPLPLQRPPMQRYVKGFIPPQLLQWDAISAIRAVCWRWHEWALERCLKDVHLQRGKGGERWAELSNRRSSYPLYELIDRPTGTAVYRDPLTSLKQTVKLCNDYPGIASKIRRMSIHDFYTSPSNCLVLDLLVSCTALQALSVPWTTVRQLNADTWQVILLGKQVALQSLEIQCVDPTSQQAATMIEHMSLAPLKCADFSRLRRLKVFGDTNLMPIVDADMCAIAHTATQLEELHVTCNSTITINGIMAVVKASRKTLQVLEHSPRSQNGFWHPHPGCASTGDHLCKILRSCSKLETLSVSLPSVCAHLFCDDGVKFRGNMQVRALYLCEYKNSAQGTVDALIRLLRQARRLIYRRAQSLFDEDLYVELFFAHCIFEPGFESVHGDFHLAYISSGGLWPQGMRQSSKGPYGSTGLYEQKDERPYQCIEEAEYLRGILKHHRALCV